MNHTNVNKASESSDMREEESQCATVPGMHTN